MRANNLADVAFLIIFEFAYLFSPQEKLARSCDVGNRSPDACRPSGTAVITCSATEAHRSKHSPLSRLLTDVAILGLPTLSCARCDSYPRIISM